MGSSRSCMATNVDLPITELLCTRTKGHIRPHFDEIYKYAWGDCDSPWKCNKPPSKGFAHRQQHIDASLSVAKLEGR